MPALVVPIVLAVLVAVAAVGWWRSRTSARESTAELAAMRTTAGESAIELIEHRARLRLVRELEEVAVRSAAQVVQAMDAVALAADRDGDAARRGAVRARDEALEVVAQLRRIGTLAVDGGAAAQPAPVRPVADLIEQERERGLAVAVQEHGDPFPLRGGAEAAVFRVIEHALANARQHGGPGTTAQLTYRWSDSGLQLHIDDDGERTRAAASDAPADRIGVADDVRALTEEMQGPGLAELRARVALFGGTVRAQRVPGVGVSVAAYLPTLRHHNGVHGIDLGVRG